MCNSPYTTPTARGSTGGQSPDETPTRSRDQDTSAPICGSHRCTDGQTADVVVTIPGLPGVRVICDNCKIRAIGERGATVVRHV